MTPRAPPQDCNQKIVWRRFGSHFYLSYHSSRPPRTYHPSSQCRPEVERTGDQLVPRRFSLLIRASSACKEKNRRGLTSSLHRQGPPWCTEFVIKKRR